MYEVSDVDELAVVSVGHDDGVVTGVLADQGGEDVEQIPVDKPLGPPSPCAAAKQGELGGVAGVAQVIKDEAGVKAKRHIHLDVTKMIKETWIEIKQ